MSRTTSQKAKSRAWSVPPMKALYESLGFGGGAGVQSSAESQPESAQKGRA